MDVSNLWNGCLYRTGIEKNSACPDFFEGMFLYDWNFRCGTGSGSVLKYFKICPWDYSSSQIQYKGLIRADYAPLWFLTGLLFEKILSDNS